MVIGVSGFGFTGSGAVVDLLKEYSDLQVLDKAEFKLSYMPDGIETLRFHLVDHPCRFFSSDPAIRRFRQVIREFTKDYQRITHCKFLQIADEYVTSLVDLTWKGTSSFHKVGISRFERYFKYSFLRRVRATLYKRFNIWIPFYDKDMYLSISPESFDMHSKRFLASIIHAMGGVQEKVVLNQPFPADRPEFSFPYYDDPYAITVSRDPRDLYILAKEYVKPRARFIPTDSVEDFIIYYRKIMENTRKSTADSTHLLRIRFEDLIFNYNTSVKEIEEFLGISKHNKKKTYFNPDVSSRNTQLFRKSSKYLSDIEKIEQQLSEWLYPFEKLEDRQDVEGAVF